MRAIVTRPGAEATVWQRLLRDAGIDAVSLPLIDIVPPDDDGTVAAEWRRLGERRVVVFVSPSAVRGFFAGRPADVSGWPAAAFAAAPGPGTAVALRAAGVDAARVVEPAADAASFDSEALWAELDGLDWRGSQALIVRGEGGREWLADRLAEAGATVDTVCAYRRRAPAWTADAWRVVEAARAAKASTVWLFSSSQAIDHLLDAAGAAGWAGARAVATHARIAARAREAGFGDVREAAPTPASVIACIQSMRP